MRFHVNENTDYVNSLMCYLPSTWIWLYQDAIAGVESGKARERIGVTKSLANEVSQNEVSPNKVLSKKIIYFEILLIMDEILIHQSQILISD